MLYVFSLPTNNESGQYVDAEIRPKLLKVSVARRNLALAKPSSQYIRGSLKAEFDLTSAKRQQPVLRVPDLEVLLHHLWVKDMNPFRVERARIQLALCLQLLAFSAQQPGVLALSKGYTHHRDALTYGVSLFSEFKLLGCCSQGDRISGVHYNDRRVAPSKLA